MANDAVAAVAAVERCMDVDASYAGTAPGVVRGRYAEMEALHRRVPCRLSGGIC